ncbi:hypothetical protein ABPG74_016991 [Tetrahymena malaccensis]
MNLYQFSFQKFQYDYFVIGGGSGGQASAKEAASFGARVGLADFVKPSPQGSTWGLGGTCVNVGCVPKKMFHYASEFGDILEHQRNAGWEVPHNINHNWSTLVNKVQTYIKRLNGIYMDALKDKKVTYYNAFASLKDKNTIELEDINGNKTQVTSKYILLALGGRPKYLEEIPNIRELAITSDDIFFQQTPPGKTLVVGASYVALECAGFLNGLGYDVTVLVRSKVLANFDQEFAQKVKSFMQKHGVKFIEGAIPSSIKLSEQGQDLKHVEYKNTKTGEVIGQDHFKTVLIAVGRGAQTKGVNLEQIGVQLTKDGKIVCDDSDTTAIPNVFSVGDCVEGRLELTPTAIKAGRMLARRLFNNQKSLMQYHNVPTTIFTPLEFGTVGLSEEQAAQKYGKDNLNIWISTFKPMDWQYSIAKQDDRAICKLITVKNDNDKVIGLHYIGPQAAEVTQGFAVAIQMGANKEDFDNTVAIHPSYAEEFVLLRTPRL